MRFSVVTPTFNRVHTLHRVYESLCAQTFRDFEWVVIDDGSTDETESLVKSWSPTFPLTYFKQPNGGKHRAMNAGVARARGELVVFFDSDDWCIPTALERFDYHWEQIHDPRFANITCLCIDTKGKIVGDRIDQPFIDLYSLTDHIKLRSGERWGLVRRDVLLEFPFPEYDGEKYAPEGLVWNRISSRYASRFINEALRVYEPAGADGISTRSVKLRRSAPKATTQYYRELAFSNVPLLVRLKAAINFVRFSVSLL